MRMLGQDCIKLTPSGLSSTSAGDPGRPGISSPVMTPLHKRYSMLFGKVLFEGQKTNQGSLIGEAALIPGGSFPDDLDTTALAVRALEPSSPETISEVLNLMAEYVNNDGTIQVSRRI